MNNPGPETQRPFDLSPADRADGRLWDEPDRDPAVESAWSQLTEITPDRTRMQNSRIVTYAGKQQEATAFNVLRTKMLQQMRQNGWRRVAITSPTASCGKSTVSLNLAFSLGRQSDLRTILAEADLRRPSLARVLGLKPRQSFARVLEGTGSFAQNAVRYRDNLAFATNDTAWQHPAELFHSRKVGPILADIEATYRPDVMLFDLLPMLVSDDVMAFVPHVDCVILVAAAETTTVKEIDACERELASQTQVMGIVLNKCRYLGKEYGYSYYG